MGNPSRVLLRSVPKGFVRRLEVFYVATSLLVPILIASVPLITGSYRIVYTTAGNHVCYIMDPAGAGSNIALIERFVLWGLPRFDHPLCVFRSHGSDGDKIGMCVRQIEIRAVQKSH